MPTTRCPHVHVHMHRLYFYRKKISLFPYLSVCPWQVLDVRPLPGMVVNPPDGVVPSRGHAVLSIHFTPDCVIKFDTRVKVRKMKVKTDKACLLSDRSLSVCVCVLQIALRKMKAIELRVGGCVEPPNVDFSVVSVSVFIMRGRRGLLCH